ncbi:MAG TPA: FtsX-like permease family protein [Candidatus Hydrogenedentes bacterium]|nr:FtsX-like permease family protein [Candidatus Hydrogenedentota bacterium]
MNNHQRIFADDASRRQLVMPWARTFEMCWKSLVNRRGRFLLVFISIAVVVAFFVSTLTYHRVVAALRENPDVHTKAVLERAGLLSNNPDAEQKERDRVLWLLVLSGLLCFVGVTNTMYMSVTERYREIGTLKCLGALNGFVVRLFLIESILVGLASSAIGALAGYLLTVLQLGVALEFGLLEGRRLLGSLLFVIPPAILGGAALTVLAAVYPTWTAARMKPVDAMRVEV